jgi:hypothetical protein
MLPELSITKNIAAVFVPVLSTYAVSLHASTDGAMPTTLYGTEIVLLLNVSGQTRNFITQRLSAVNTRVTVIVSRKKQKYTMDFFIAKPLFKRYIGKYRLFPGNIVKNNPENPLVWWKPVV